MPWVLVATSVYQEGVDLHTFCRNVIHHGIAGQASAIEQRTGRVDRIGGLIQRSAASLSGLSEDHGWKIQSLFPYQSNTFEKHQVRRVLHNCNRFIESIHEISDREFGDGKACITDRFEHVPPQITDRLQSPFAVDDQSLWLSGDLSAAEVDRSSYFCEASYRRELDSFERGLERMASENGASLSISPGQFLERRYHFRLESCHVDLKLTPSSNRDADDLQIEISSNVATHADAIFDDCPSKGDGWADRALEHARCLLAEEWPSEKA